MDDYSAKSSLNGAAEENERPAIVPVGSASREKKSVFRRFFDSLVVGTMQDVRRTVMDEVIIPKAKDLVTDMVDRGMDILFYNDTRSRRRTDYRRESRSSLGNAYINYGDSGRRASRPARRDYDDDYAEMEDGYLTWESKAEAEEAKQRLLDYLEEYESVSVGHLYELGKWKTKPSDFEYGWYNLSTIRVERTRGGRYRLVTPKPVSLT